MQISDYDAVMKLWRDCEGLSLRDADSASGVEKYLERNPGLSFVALDGTRIVGSIMERNCAGSAWRVNWSGAASLR
jgi:predicted N-acetyltransferase YhbS